MSAAPQLTIHLRNFSDAGDQEWSGLLDRARAADAAGVDRVIVSDHVVFGEELEEYGRPEVGGIAGGTQPTGPDGQWLEPLTVLGVVTGITSQVRLGTSVLLAALRRPVVLAKAVATLDVLSDGRLDLGVGVGWQRAEYDAAGLHFDERGRLLDHTLSICTALWDEGSATVDDRDIRFEAIHCVPKPRQTGGVPIWVSGRLNRNVLARIVRFGAGWIPWGDAIADPAQGIIEVRRAFEDVGRDPADLRVLGTLPVVRDRSQVVDLGATVAQVPSLVMAGVTDFRVGWPVPNDRDAATETLTRLVDAFRDVVGRDPHPAP